MCGACVIYVADDSRTEKEEKMFGIDGHRSCSFDNSQLKVLNIAKGMRVLFALMCETPLCSAIMS